MKTAQEWQNEFPYRCSVECEGDTAEQTETIKAIQLDAWKQGMTNAAIIAKNNNLACEECCQFIRHEIENERDEQHGFVI